MRANDGRADQGGGDVAPWWAGRQRILNARGVPGRFTHAPEPVPVTVRVRWADDGEEELAGEAYGWTVPLVLVTVDDPRSAFRGIWVPAADVRRRPRA